MAAEQGVPPKVAALRIEAAPPDVDAGADVRLRADLSGGVVGPQRAGALIIRDEHGTLVASTQLEERGDDADGPIELVVKAPVRPGTYRWLAEYSVEADISDAGASAPFSFTVKPHTTRVVVWDVPTAVERGERFSVKLGLKCHAACRPDGWMLEIRDHHGATQARVRVSDAPWAGTAALYYAEVGLQAPDAEGLFAWEARAPATAAGMAHGEGIASFGVRVAPRADCTLTVIVLDAESQAPVQGARVVVHPYRAVTNERGVARLEAPQGSYTLFVSGGDYFPFRSDCVLETDTTVTAKLVTDLGPSDAEIWS